MKELIKRMPILDVNSDDRSRDGLYPIQPYTWEGDVHVGFPSSPYMNIVAFYHQTQPNIKRVNRTIYPSGSTAIVCRLNEENPESFLVGTPTFPKEPEYITGKGEYFVALFWIGVGFSLFPLPPSDITDKHIPLNKIFPGKAESLVKQMIHVRSFSQRVHIFERFLSEIISDSRQIPMQYKATIRTIYQESIMDLGLEKEKPFQTGFSNRHTRRIFKKYVGISPKLFKRIIRYQKSLNLINTHPKQSMAYLAAKQGYFDQSHFIKEFKRFQGMTPVEFIRKFIVNKNPGVSTSFLTECQGHEKRSII